MRTAIFTVLAAILFPVAHLCAQRLEIEVSPRQPTVMQEFEVSYISDRPIGSIDMPRWGVLTLVRELGRSQGTSMSIENGVATRTQLHACRYRVLCGVSGEVSVPGTAAVVDGRKCRFDPVRITVLPAASVAEPVCRIGLDSAAAARFGGCVVRLSCNCKPDSSDPVLLVDGVPHTPSLRHYSGGTEEEYLYLYRIDLPRRGWCEVVPQLSFGGEPYPMAPCRLSARGLETASASRGRAWGVWLLPGLLLFLWGALFVRDRTAFAGRGAVVSRFSWRGYMLIALIVCFSSYVVFVSWWLFSPERAVSLSVVFVALLMLFALCLLVFGELRRSAVRLHVDGRKLIVIPFMGLGPARVYDLTEFDGITTSLLTVRGSTYECAYLMRGDRRVVSISSFYLRNYRELCDAVAAVCPYMGRRPMGFLFLLRDIFS